MLVCTLAKRNGNYNISIVTLSRQNEGIFKILIICFHLLGMNPNQDRQGCHLQESVHCTFSFTHLTQQKYCCGNRCESNDWSRESLSWLKSLHSTCYGFFLYSVWFSSLKLNFLMIFSNFFNTPTKDCFLISFSDYASVAQPLAGGQSWRKCWLGNISCVHLCSELWWWKFISNWVYLETKLCRHRDTNYCLRNWMRSFMFNLIY